MENNKEKQGIIAALLSLIFWGIVPLYWQALRPIDSHVIIFYRIFLAALVCLLAGIFRYGAKSLLIPLKNTKQTRRFILAGIIITANWSLYIWAVNANLVIQTCLGYYIEPMVVAVLGIVLFKERLDKYKSIAFGLVFMGLVVLLTHFGELPVVALILAGTFAAYAALKKTLKTSPVIALLYETIFLMPVALAVIIYKEVHGVGALGVAQPYQLALLLLAGVFTAIPLGLFGYATNHVPLTTLGIIQYISPSITLIIGIFLLKEPFDRVQFFSFVVIWIGLVVFTWGSWRKKSLQKFF